MVTFEAWRVLQEMVQKERDDSAWKAKRSFVLDIVLGLSGITSGILVASANHLRLPFALRTVVTLIPPISFLLYADLQPRLWEKEYTKQRIEYQDLVLEVDFFMDMSRSMSDFERCWDKMVKLNEWKYPLPIEYRRNPYSVKDSE
jgi:hypothetical protein